MVLKALQGRSSTDVSAFTTAEGGASISRDGIVHSFSLNLPAVGSGSGTGTADGMMSDEPHANGSLGTENGRRRRIDIFGSSTIWSAHRVTRNPRQREKESEGARFMS